MCNELAWPVFASGQHNYSYTDIATVVNFRTAHELNSGPPAPEANLKQTRLTGQFLLFSIISGRASVALHF